MYKVLVVDDEKIGRDGISFLLKQSSYDFDITEAQNGKVALQYIKNNDVDLLFTDIKMPFIDGIELIEIVAKMKPQMKIIILSGYSDFEYAKKAMKMGVSEYLLKPIDPNEFNSSLEKMVNQLESSKKEQLKMKRQNVLLKEHILLSLVNGNSIDHIEKQLDGLSVRDFIGHYFRIMLIEFNRNFYGEVFDFVDQLRNNISIDFDYINLNLEQSLLFFKEDNEDKLKAVAYQIIRLVAVQYTRRCYIALSNTIKDLSLMNEIERQLEDLVDNKYFYTDKQLYLMDENLIEISVDNFDDVIKVLEDDLKLKDTQSLRKDLEGLYLSNAQARGYTVDYLKFKLSVLVKQIYKNLSYSSERNINEQIALFYHSKDLNEMIQILYLFVDELEKEFHKGKNLVHKEIESVKKYIYNHYNEDLSVDQLADYVCLAPSYLSHIFKKETGENLGKFIKRVRMEKAKDMLENSYEKIVTISVAVGYQNVSYFCQSFREYFGISPQKYRSKGE